MAVGQGYLMALYERAMERHGIKVAQVLLTRSDLADRRRYQNAFEACGSCSNGAFGSSSTRTMPSHRRSCVSAITTPSALVAAVGAHKLILLTDVDRLYSADPRVDADARPISDVHHPRELEALQAGAGDGALGHGWDDHKLAAARIATASGITVHLADGRDPGPLDVVLAGGRGGTVFHPHPEPLGNRRSWLAHVLQPEGVLHLDAGACAALQHRGASLLLVGITAVDGDFESSCAVSLVDPSGDEFGRGLCSIASSSLRNALAASDALSRSTVVVHRDALVLNHR